MEKLTVGYALSDKKFKAIDFDRVVNLAKKQGLNCEKICLTNPTVPSGGVDIIVAKLTDALSALEKPENEEMIKNWKKFEQENPGVVLIDAVATQEIVTDRIVTCEKLDLLHQELNEKSSEKILHPPRWGIVPEGTTLSSSSLSSLGVQFPVMCKTINACGSHASHQMGLVCNEEGLKEFSSPVFVQEFYNHNAVIFKIFVVGSEFHVQPRTSLPDVDLSTLSATSSFVFNSQGINKNISSSSESSSSSSSSESSSSSSVPALSPRLLSAIPEFINLVKKHFGMTLFGFDVIVHTNNGRGKEGELMSVIDLNFFPGYIGMDKFPQAFLDLCDVLVKEKK